MSGELGAVFGVAPGVVVHGVVDGDGGVGCPVDVEGGVGGVLALVVDPYFVEACGGVADFGVDLGAWGTSGHHGLEGGPRPVECVARDGEAEPDDAEAAAWGLVVEVANERGHACGVAHDGAFLCARFQGGNVLLGDEGGEGALGIEDEAVAVGGQGDVVGDAGGTGLLDVVLDAVGVHEVDGVVDVFGFFEGVDLEDEVVDGLDEGGEVGAVHPGGEGGDGEGRVGKVCAEGAEEIAVEGEFSGGGIEVDL